MSSPCTCTDGRLGVQVCRSDLTLTACGCGGTGGGAGGGGGGSAGASGGGSSAAGGAAGGLASCMNGSAGGAAGAAGGAAGAGTVPVIVAASATPTVLFDGGVITLTVEATSQSPVNFLSGSFSGPAGTIWGGGSGVTFTEVSPGRWRHSRTETIDAFAPSGTYSYTDLRVENQAQLTSAPWPNPVNVCVMNALTAGPPVITSVTATPSMLFDGGVITLTVVATSQAPVTFFGGSFAGPAGTIWGGGSGVTFTETSPGTWRYSRTESISSWAPSGTYSYTNLTVENQAQLRSAPWPNPVNVSVTNTRTSGPPVITSVTATPTMLFDGGVITLTVVATSQAPVSFFGGSFSGPAGNIWGGGSGVTFTETSPGTWRHSRTDTISAFAPSGTYSYTNLTVENEAQLTSAPWPNPVSVSVTNR